MTSETTSDAERYLGDVEYPAGKDDLVTAAKANEVSEGFLKRLVALPISEYSSPEAVAQALDNLTPQETNTTSGEDR